VDKAAATHRAEEVKSRGVELKMEIVAGEGGEEI
jgi:hypothetical protein